MPMPLEYRQASADFDAFMKDLVATSMIQTSHQAYTMLQAVLQGQGLAQLGADWSVDARSRLLVSVARREVGGTDRAQNTWTLGYDYALSKRTVLYARWLQLGNAANASAAIANVPVAANSGDGVRSLALGVRHNF